MRCMPLYEYQCESCGHQFEAIVKFSDPPLEKCPKCAGPVRKLQSAPAIQFTGSGWYITDYAKKESPGPAKDAAQPDAKTGADGTSETKTEKKSDAAPAASETKTAKD